MHNFQMKPHEAEAKTAGKLPWHDAWMEVDQTSDPQWFVRFLDATRLKKRRKAAADPEQYFAHLDIQPGQHVLELGCGTGDFLEPLARLVGENGRVVGLDKSEVMINEARSRAVHPITEFFVGDAQALEFANKSFDRCFATTLLQHLSDPKQALLELVRVTKPGGKISVTEQDWETLVVSADDKAVTRRILDCFCDNIPNGWIGRQLVGLFKEVGLADITVTAATFTSTDMEWTEQTLGLKAMIRRAEDVGAVSSDEGRAWLAELETRARQSKFFAAFTAFCVVGTKPNPSYY